LRLKIGAHDCGEIVLHLAFARIAPRDAQLLARRRRIDIEPRDAGREPGQRIDVRHVQPVRATIVWHPEGGGIGEAAPADAVAGLEQDVAPPSRGDFARCINSGGARPDDRHIGLARGRDGAERRPGGDRCRARDKSAPIERHGFRMIARTRTLPDQTAIRKT
jgi:hypothetical protein